MSHFVESMAFSGQSPWHQIGFTDQPIEAWAKHAGMTWTIKSAQARYVPEHCEHIKSPLAVPGKRILYRSDNHLPLSVVSDRYHIVQPQEVLEFYRDLTDSQGYELETAGVLKGGKKLWALANTGKRDSLKGGDVTQGYLLLATACDGSMATTAQFTSIRVVCNNTLSLALKGGEHAVRVRHNTALDADTVKTQLGIRAGSWDNFMLQLRALSERHVTRHEARHYFSELLQLEATPTEAQQPARTLKHMERLYNGDGRGSRLSTTEHTAYGLLNAVTEYVDHHKRAHNCDYRLDSAWFGAGSRLKQLAFNQAIELL
ncbi:Uncharacterised protein [BD1-7 clade bacterium]|uniref:Phage/plasmid-like protein n=1 Tax=BD1-7 clade bacterium TaxID=2029982 RepID=A0A5S9QTS9_9GAMM|nr:Uncharacterised protein [BD1-7 clade bacterium]CAA0123001.1 Uncharacterised protein [BD1-7 clade bacterium]